MLQVSAMQDVFAAPVGDAPMGLNREPTLTHFQERARHYWYAAAMTSDPRNIEGFLALAFMFERMADEVSRLETREAQSAALRRSREAGPPLPTCAGVLSKILDSLAGLIRRVLPC